MDNVARPALARMLDEGLDGGSVLLVAGAGYGKTTALEEALRASKRKAVWLSCATTGGDAGRLLYYGRRPAPNGAGPGRRARRSACGSGRAG